MPAIPTVLVKFRKGKGWGRINEDDFDPDLHELIEGEVETPLPAPKAAKESDESKAEGSEEKPLDGMNRAELIERLEKAGGDLAKVKGTGKNSAVKNTDIVAAIQEAEAKKGE